MSKRHRTPKVSEAPEAKGDTLHMKRFMQGRFSPEEVHIALGVNKRCEGCGRPGVGHIRTFWEADEFAKREPLRAMSIAMLHGGNLPVVKSTYGDLFMVSQITPCANCWREAEKAAADHPDWVYVEISRPHRSNRFSAQVPKNYVSVPMARQVAGPVSLATATPAGSA